MLLQCAAYSGAGLDGKPLDLHLDGRSGPKGTSMRNRSTLLVAAALMLSLGAAPAMAEKVFGAIAFSASTGKFGWVKNSADKAVAQSDAVASCGQADCDTVVVFPACAAMSVGDGFGMGFSADKSVTKAEETALAQCDSYTTNCIISTSLCND